MTDVISRDDFEVITGYPSEQPPFHSRGAQIEFAEEPEFEGRSRRCVIYRTDDGRFVAEYFSLTCRDGEWQIPGYEYCANAAEVEISLLFGICSNISLPRADGSPSESCEMWV